MSFPRPKTRCTGILTTRSNQYDASPGLLQLPIEIRDMIYRRVLGGMLLHSRRGRFSTGASRSKWVICRATISEKNAQRHFDQAKAPAWYVQDDTNRHAECYKTASLQRLDLNLLLVCRQVHREAKHILFSTNTFSFRRSSLLGTFLGLDNPTNPKQRLRSRSHHLAVCSIHLDISVRCMEEAWYWKMIMPQIPEVLPNLSNINISFTQGTPLFYYEQEDISKTARDGAAQWQKLMESLLDLEDLPLRSATFDINDRNITHRWSVAETMLIPEVFQEYLMAEKSYRWTIEEKQSRAKAVKDAILRSSS